MSENFITFPLWEEGKYIPFVNFWQILKTPEQLKKMEKIEGYEIIFEKRTMSNTYNFSIYPDFEDLDDGGYEFIKKDWSIEEMFDIIEKIINKKYLST